MAEHDERLVDAVAVPATTSWPLLAALGATLVFAGLVTHVLVTIVGVVVFFVSSVGWFRTVLPAEEHEIVPFVAASLRARAVVVSTRKVEHLEPGGVEAHRMRLPLEIHPYSAGIWGGMAGGVAMAALACLFGIIDQGSIWYPINLLAAAALPSLAGADTAQLRMFDATGFFVAAIVHGLMSVLNGLLYAMILPALPRLPILLGGIVAPILWSGLVWASLGIMNPALNERIHWGWFVASQIGFGLVAGLVIDRTERVRTMQALPIAVRMGFEGGIREDGDDGRKA